MTKEQWFDFPYDERRVLLKKLLQELVDSEKLKKVNCKKSKKKNKEQDQTDEYNRKVSHRKTEDQIIDIMTWEKEAKLTEQI